MSSGAEDVTQRTTFYWDYSGARNGAGRVGLIQYGNGFYELSTTSPVGLWKKRDCMLPERQQGGAAQDEQVKFGTYWRDSVSGLDYAQNRYFAASQGRFTSADPYVMSGGMGNPQGWNRYAYVAADPVNFNDPWGLYASVVGSGSAEEPVCDPLNTRWAPGTGPCSDAVGAPADGPPLNRELLPAALSRALHALSLNKDCLELFGNDQTRANGFDPSAVLISIVGGGTEFAQLKFKDMGATSVAAVTGGWLGRPVIMTINSCNDTNIYWNDGFMLHNAHTLLHEPGHAYDLIRGSGGSAIKSPDDYKLRLLGGDKNGRWNDWRVDLKCFNGAIGYKKP